MKKTTTMRIIAFLLSLLCVATVAMSCATPDDSGNADTTKPADAGEPDATTAEAAVTTNPYSDEVPAELRFEGKTISIIIRTEEAAKDEIGVEDMNGGTINDAVFKRDTDVQQRLGITMEIEATTAGDTNAVIATLEKTISAGDSNIYHVLINNSYKSLAAAVKGDFQNLYEIDNIDLEKPYWSKGFNDEISIGNAQYVATGPFSLSFYRYLEIVGFNKNMFKTSNVEYPYQKVRDMKWTADEQISIIKNFYMDKNGNGADMEDTLGFVTRAASCLSDGYWSAYNLKTVTKTDDNYYQYHIDTDHFSKAVEKINELYYTEGAFCKAEKDEDVYRKFGNSDAAMANLRLYCVETDDLRNMSDEYGFLPMPMLNEEQGKYISYCQDQLLIYAIPKNVTEDQTDMVGAFLEVYASESYKTVKTAYYDIVLSSRYVKDEDSIEMLDLITNSLYLDASALYVGTLPFSVSKLRSLTNDKSTDIASIIKQYDIQMNALINMMNKNYKKLVTE